MLPLCGILVDCKVKEDSLIDFLGLNVNRYPYAIAFSLSKSFCWRNDKREDGERVGGVMSTNSMCIVVSGEILS